MKDTYSILGHTGFYIRFVIDFSTIARPLFHLFFARCAVWMDAGMPNNIYYVYGDTYHNIDYTISGLVTTIIRDYVWHNWL